MGGINDDVATYDKYGNDGDTKLLLGGGLKTSRPGSVVSQQSLFSPIDDLTATRSGGCFGLQRGTRRFCGRHGLLGVWFWCRVAFGLFGTTCFWVGAWNLGQFDCCFTPETPICVQNFSSPGDGVAEDTPTLQYWYGRPGLPRAPLGDTPLGSPGRDIWDDKLPWGLGGPNTLAFRGQFTMVLGWLLLIMSDSLYYNIGVEAGMFRWCHRLELKATCAGRLILVFRMVLGLIGSTLFWGGMYQAVVYTPPLNHWTFCHPARADCGEDWVIHTAVFIIGILLVVATGSWSGTTFLYNDEADEEPNPLQRIFFMHDAEDESCLSFSDKIRYALRATISLFGQTLLWISSTRGLDSTADPNGDTVWRPMTYMWVGIAVMAMTDSLPANSWTMDVTDDSHDVETKDDEDDAGVSQILTGGPSVNGMDDLNNTYTDQSVNATVDEAGNHMAAIKFYFISFFSLLGQLTFVYGLWVLLDSFWFKTATIINDPGTWLQYRSTELNVYMILIGLTFTAAGGAMMTNAGLSTIPVYKTETSTSSNAYAHDVREELANLEKSLVREDRSNTLKSIHLLRDITAGSPLVRRRRLPMATRGERSKSFSDMEGRDDRAESFRSIGRAQALASTPQKMSSPALLAP